MNLHRITKLDLLRLSFPFTLACTRRSRTGRVGDSVGGITGAKTMSRRRFGNCPCCSDYRRGTTRSSSPAKISDPKHGQVLSKTNLEVAGSVLSVSDLIEALRFKGNSS